MYGHGCLWTVFKWRISFVDDEVQGCRLGPCSACVRGSQITHCRYSTQKRLNVLIASVVSVCSSSRSIYHVCLLRWLHFSKIIAPFKVGGSKRKTFVAKYMCFFWTPTLFVPTHLLLPSDFLLLDVALFPSLVHVYRQRQKCTYYVASTPVLPFNCFSPLWPL